MSSGPKSRRHLKPTNYSRTTDFPSEQFFFENQQSEKNVKICFASKMETWSFDFEADNTSDHITSDNTTSNNTTSGNTTTSGNNTNYYKRASTVDDFILPVPGAYFCVCPQVAGLGFFSTNFLPPYVAFEIRTHISRAAPWPGTFEGRSTNWATAPRLQQLMTANQATSFNRRLIATFVGKTNSAKKIWIVQPEIWLFPYFLKVSF